MKRWQTVLVVAGLAVALAVVNGAIVLRERLLRDGTVVLLELAPVDPRSLMQGDYMALDFALARSIASTKGDAPPADGYAMLALDANGVASLAGVETAAGASMPATVPLRFRVRDRRVQIASNAWFFAEGTASRYEPARYGELRVGADGEALLTGLRDAALEPL